MDKTNMAIAVFDKHAQEYEQRFMDVSLYADAIDMFCDSLPQENVSILELACGPGNITRYLLDKMPKLNILATDLSANMLELAKKNNPEANFELLDCRDIAKLTQKFDGVVCGFCLPYLSKEETLNLIKDTAGVLNENGVFYLSTIDGNYSNSGLTTNSHCDSVYMYYYEEDFLKQALVEDFNIVSIKHKEYDYKGTQVKDVIVIAIKKS